MRLTLPEFPQTSTEPSLRQLDIEISRMPTGNVLGLPAGHVRAAFTAYYNAMLQNWHDNKLLQGQFDTRDTVFRNQVDNKDAQPDWLWLALNIGGMFFEPLGTALDFIAALSGDPIALAALAAPFVTAGALHLVDKALDFRRSVRGISEADDILSLPRRPREGFVSPYDLYYSQGSVSYNLSRGVVVEGGIKRPMNIDDLANIFGQSGWDMSQGGIRVVEFQDGWTVRTVTLDNRRPIAARRAELEYVPATIYSSNDSMADLSNEFRRRFMLEVDSTPELEALLPDRNDLGYGVLPNTWGEAAIFRAANQAKHGFPGFPLTGSLDLPSIIKKYLD